MYEDKIDNYYFWLFRGRSWKDIFLDFVEKWNFQENDRIDILERKMQNIDTKHEK